MNQEEREKRIEILVHGRNSDYWRLLEERIKEWIALEEKALDIWKHRKITENEISEQNRAVDRIKYLRSMLRMNEVLIEENRTILDQMRRAAAQAYSFTRNYFNGFVKDRQIFGSQAEK